MKRTFLKSLSVIALLLTAAATPATAQDTLRIRGPKDNYYSTSWFDTVGQHAYFSQWGFGPETDLLVKYFYTPDTLTVYGIAACVIPENYRREHRDEELLEYYGFDISTEPSDGYPPYYLRSSSYDSCYEYFRLYQATPSWWRPDSNLVLQPGQEEDSVFMEMISHWGQTVPGNPIQKGEDLMKQYNGKAQDLNGYAAVMGVKVDTANVVFATGEPRIEPGVVGRMCVAKQGTLQGPIKGDDAIYVYQIVKQDKAERKPTKEELDNRYAQRRGAQKFANRNTITHILNKATKVKKRLIDFY